MTKFFSKSLFLACAFVLAGSGNAIAISPVVENQFATLSRTNAQITAQAARISGNPAITKRLTDQAARRVEANIRAAVVRALTSSPKDGQAIAERAISLFPQHETMIRETTKRTLPALSKRFGSASERQSKAKVPYYVPRSTYARTAVTTASNSYPTYTSNLSGMSNRYSTASYQIAQSHQSTIRSTGSPELPDRTGSGDPLEGVNRGMLAVNDTLDMLILKPIAQGYDFILPEFAQTGVRNVFQNLTEPSVILNNVLQGDLPGAGRSGARFIVNSTFGLLGLFDVAAMNGDMPFESADFGQTLHTYGVGEGAYLVLPLLGPHTSRDALGAIVDIATNPTTYATFDTGVQIAISSTNIISQREAIMPAYDNMKENSLDWYTTLRSSYLQNRRNFLEKGSNDPFGDGTYQLGGNDPFDSFD